MRSEAWIFAMTTTFFVIVSPLYWFLTYDWTGTSALTMTTLLAGMVTVFLGFHARRMDPRPEDRKDGEIADGRPVHDGPADAPDVEGRQEALGHRPDRHNPEREEDR